MPTVSSILSDFSTLSTTEQNEVKERLLHLPVASGSLNEFVALNRFADGRECVHCHGRSVVRYGHDRKGRQRYLCRDCGKTFVATSNSIVASTKKDITVWEKFIDCMLNGFPLRKTASTCGIHRNTAFYWRHKVLDALQTMASKVELEGIIEADEAFFDVSYKGQKVLPRPARHRGKSSKKRGLSSDKVCVPCAVNRTGLSIATVSNLAVVKIAGLRAVLGGRIKSGSTLVTDEAKAYRKIAKENSLSLKQLKAGTPSRKGIFHLQHINSYHSKLKGFIYKFNGVSSKYLNNYLIWHNFVNYSKEEYQEKRRILMSFALTTYRTECVRDLSKRPVLPLLA